jgi:hypothetical protein
VLAIISLVMGLAAPLAIAAPFLMAIPLFGIAVSLIALRRIAVSGGTLAGRWPATIGLVLCVASAVFPVSHDMIQRMMRIHDAETFGKKWVGMVASGDLKEAFHRTVEGNRPAPPATDPMGQPVAAPKVSPYETFTAQPLIKALQAIGPNPNIVIRSTADYQAATYRNISVRQVYSVSPAPASSGGTAQPVEFVLSIQRATLPREGMSRWLIANIAPPKADGDSSPTK